MSKRLWMILSLCALLAPSIPSRAEASPVVPARHRHRILRHRPYFHSWYYRPYFSGWWGGFGYYGYYPPYYRRPYGYGPSPDWAAIDTDISPEDAEVHLDGKFIGLADDFDGYPDFLYLKRGRYRLEFRLEGFEPRSIELQARPGMKLRIDERLGKIRGAKRFGSYEPRQPEGGVRRFWAKRKEVTESVTDEEEIFEGRASPGLLEEEEEAEEPPKGEAREQWREGPKAPAEEGKSKTRLKFRVSPSDAAVYLDDRFIGTAEELNALSRGLSVAPGKHTLEVSRPGFQSRSLEIEAEEGEAEQVEVSLKK